MRDRQKKILPVIEMWKVKGKQERVILTEDVSSQKGRVVTRVYGTGPTCSS